MGHINLSSIVPGSTLALDTMVFIYFLERHPKYFHAVEALFRGIEQERNRGVICSLVFTELLVPAYRSGKQDLALRTFKHLNRFPHLSVIPVSAEIAREGARLRACHGLPTPDSLHAATALNQKADFIITNDRHFDKIQPEIPVIYLDD